jgi:hypothetical protein
MAELKIEHPGAYVNADHSIFRITKGAVGLLKVEGLALPPLFFGREMVYTLGAWSR